MLAIVALSLMRLGAYAVDDPQHLTRAPVFVEIDAGPDGLRDDSVLFAEEVSRSHR